MRNKTKQIVIITLACLAVAGLALSCSSQNKLGVRPGTEEAVPATFQLSGLSITPTEAAAHEQIFITADATNVGTVDDFYEARLKINNSIEFSNKVTIPAGQTQTLTFAVSKEQAGTYQVSLGDLVGQFVVAEPVATRPYNQISAISGLASGSCCGIGNQTSPAIGQASGGCCGIGNQTSPAIGQAGGGCCGIGNQTSPAIGQAGGGCCGTGAQSNPVTPRRSCCGGG